MEFEYINHIKRLITLIEDKETDNIQKSVQLLTQTILNKKSIYVVKAWLEIS